MLEKLKKDHFEGSSNLNAGTNAPNKSSLVDILNQTRDSANILALTSDASAGGNATETMAVTGLKATDEVLSVSQKTAGAANLPLLGWSNVADNAIDCTWSADPLANAVVVVLVRRPTI